MNISYKWLKDYLNLDLSPNEVSAALTSIGLETGGIEEVQSIKGGLEGLVIGKVLTCVEHPNSDHLHITTVDLGGEEPTQIVCGAANVAAGQHVVVATVGTTLYSGEESFVIKKSKIRGEVSCGMICAEDEIGIGTSHEGIIELPESAIPGTPAKEYYNLESDFVLEVDITPNRIDAASHFGVARDLAAYLKENKKEVTLQRPSVEAFQIASPEGGVSVRVENSEACPRYCGVTIQGVTVQESPEWMQNRLKAIGVRPINNVVDITNYILHETGQPLHAFDLSHIQGGSVVVRTVEEGTPFTTLDGVERKLASSDLMICNEQEPMCIAGVFGGKDAGVKETTTDLFLESAYFNASWIRKTARRHGLNTDASFRYERGADPNCAIYVLKRAALMIQELAGGNMVGEMIDIYPTPIAPFPVELAYSKVNSLIGKEIPAETVKSILASLDIEVVAETPSGLSLLVPTYRVDVQRDVDVIEEILRIYGYNNIAFTDSVHSNLSYKTATDKGHNLMNLIAEQLTGCGFNEIMNNSLTKAALYEGGETYNENRCVRIINALSNDLSVMRQTLLFGGLESLAHNINRRRSDLRMFEFGNCYYFDGEKSSESNMLAPYSEESHLALWLTGNSMAGSWAQGDQKSSVYELKAYVENIIARLGIPAKQLGITQTSSDLYAAQLNITLRDGRLLGTVGILSGKLLKRFDIDQEVSFAELNWTLLLKEAAKSKTLYSEISKFPPVKRDLALLVDQNVQFAEIQKIALDTEKKLLKAVSLFDVYEGKNLEAGKKSYAISCILQDETKTLNDKQIDAIMNKIIGNLQHKLNAKLR